MPVSASQHRSLTGAYHNNLHNKSISNATSAQCIKRNHSAIPDEIRHFGNRVCRAANHHEEMYRPSSQKTVSPLGVAAPLLMLLSQIRLGGSSFSTSYENPAFVSNKDISHPFSNDTSQPDNNENIFSTVLNPVENALYEAGKFIYRHDPLTFPGAEAISSSSIGTESKISLDTFNNIKNGNELIPDEHKEKERDMSFLSDNLTSNIRKIIDTVRNPEEREVIIDVIKNLNDVAVEAEKKFPSGTGGDKNIDNLIYLIDNSKRIIDAFEIKYAQEEICNNLKSQQEHYIKMANDLSDNKSNSKFKKFMESIPVLTFTPDSRGEGYPPVETQIAGDLVRSVFWFENEYGYSAAYGNRYKAHKFMLASVLAEKNINSLNKLPDTWYKGDEAKRLANLLYHDLADNLKNKGDKYLLESANMFYLSLREGYTEDSSLDIKGLEGKTLREYTDKDKISALRHFFNQPVEIEFNQESTSERFLKLLDLFVTLHSIATLMRPKAWLSEREHWHSHRTISSTRTHRIPSDQFGRKVRNLNLEYDENTQKLVIRPNNRKNINSKNENMLQIDNVLEGKKKIRMVEFKNNPYLLERRNNPLVSKELKKKIQPGMYAKNIHAEDLSRPDSKGLRHSADRGEYLKINKDFVRVHHLKSHEDIKNRYFIKSDQGQNLYLRFRKDGRFHSENIRERLDATQKIGLGGRKSKLSNQLTSNERKALHDYGKQTSSDINDFMSEKLSDEYRNSFIGKSLADGVMNIKQALGKIPPYEGVVYRGTSINIEHFNTLKKNQVVTSKSFLSCSTNQELAKIYTKADMKTHMPITYEIHTQKSAHPISQYTGKFYEEEFLIESDTYFKIRDINSKMLILDEIDSSLLSNAEKATAGYIHFKI